MNPTLLLNLYLIKKNPDEGFFSGLKIMTLRINQMVLILYFGIMKLPLLNSWPGGNSGEQ